MLLHFLVETQFTESTENFLYFQVHTVNYLKELNTALMKTIYRKSMGAEIS